MKYLILFISVWISVISTAVSADEGERLLDKFISDTKTMSANFTQTLRSENGELLQESKGQFYLYKPGRFRWNYLKPYVQEIVSDGEYIWIYDVDLAQVTVQKYSVLPITPMALIQDKISVRDTFDIKLLEKKNGIYRMLLLAKSQASDFKKIILGVDENGLRFMQLKDQFDQETKIVFSNSKLNIDIDASLFQFEAPDGVDVFGGS